MFVEGYAEQLSEISPLVFLDSLTPCC